MQVRQRSEESEELSAVAVLKHGKKVVCGTQLGVLNIFSWGQIADCSDRMPGKLSFLYLAVHHNWIDQYDWAHDGNAAT